jgi:predicted secreted protein
MFIDSTYKILYIDSGNGYQPVGCLTSHSFSEESETLNTTTRDNGGWSTEVPTNQSYSISFDGLVLENLSSTQQTYYDLKNIKRDRTLINWRINEDDYGSGYIVSLNDENEIDTNVSFSAELTGYGIPVIQIDFIYDAYVARLLADGGSYTSAFCLKNYINTILID